MSKKDRKLTPRAKEKKRIKQILYERGREARKTLQGMQANAPALKDFLRRRGCNLPFYDYLDSYIGEFQKIAQEARQRFPSLLGIHEVDDSVYFSDTDWKSLGCDGEQIFFNFKEELSDYGNRRLDNKPNLSTIQGSTTAFHSPERTRTIVLIRRDTQGLMNTEEFSYVAKVIALLHEIGHVHDIEHDLNFDCSTRTVDMMSAEVFAHLYCLRELAARCLRQGYSTLLDSLKSAVSQPGYIAEVSKRVLEEMLVVEIPDWQDTLNRNPLTPDEKRRLVKLGWRE